MFYDYGYFLLFMTNCAFTNDVLKTILTY